MTTAEVILDALNKKYGFIASVLVKRDGKFLARVGDPQEPVWDDAYNTFFRDAETIANTFAFLEGQSPQVLGDGTRDVMAFQLRDDVVLGLVKDDPRNPLEMFKLQQQLAEELPSLFAGVDLDAG